MELIGDCYLALAGGPRPCPDHADRAAALASAMIAAVRSVADTQGVDLQVCA